jgi:hypothetical protein
VSGGRLLGTPAASLLPRAPHARPVLRIPSPALDGDVRECRGFLVRPVPAEHALAPSPARNR